MTETLAALLLAKLTAALPFLERAVGLVRTYDFAIPNGDDVRRVKVPVPVSFTADECEQNNYYLVPSAERGSLLWFEDGGTVSQGAGKSPMERTHESTLQLRLWLNPTRLSAELPEAVLVVALSKALGIGQRQSTPELADLLLSWTIQPGGAGLLSAYTFAQDAMPLLYPPFRVFGAEIKAVYRFNAMCQNYELPTLIPSPEC